MKSMQTSETLLSDLVKLLEAHGPEAILLALRDGCDAAADGLHRAPATPYRRASAALAQAAENLRSPGLALDDEPREVLSAALASLTDDERLNAYR